MWCKSGYEEETIDHVWWMCSVDTNAREIMIEKLCGKNFNPYCAAELTGVGKNCIPA